MMMIQACVSVMISPLLKGWGALLDHSPCGPQEQFIRTQSPSNLGYASTIALSDLRSNPYPLANLSENWLDLECKLPRVVFPFQIDRS